jgi:hypothetical protein
VSMSRGVRQRAEVCANFCGCVANSTLPTKLLTIARLTQPITPSQSAPSAHYLSPWSEASPDTTRSPVKLNCVELISPPCPAKVRTTEPVLVSQACRGEHTHGDTAAVRDEDARLS